jgi:hypothetical protein
MPDELRTRILRDIRLAEARHTRKVHAVILTVIMSVLAFSRVLKSNDWFGVGILLLLFYLFYMGWMKIERAVQKFRRQRELARMPQFSLSGEMLRLEEKNTATQEKSLNELDRVLVITTDQGPFICDNFLTLVFHDGSQWSIPLENPSHPNFYAALGKALPLDHEQALLAACSTANGAFSLWVREGIANQPL